MSSSAHVRPNRNKGPGVGLSAVPASTGRGTIKEQRGGVWTLQDRRAVQVAAEDRRDPERRKGRDRGGRAAERRAEAVLDRMSEKMVGKHEKAASGECGGAGREMSQLGSVRRFGRPVDRQRSVEDLCPWKVGRRRSVLSLCQAAHARSSR